jgi:hypothetical protein
VSHFNGTLMVLPAKLNKNFETPKEKGKKKPLQAIML